MIVRMSKIMVMGPLDLLIDTLALIERLGIMQIDTDRDEGTVDQESADQPYLLDRKSVLEHQFYENLGKKIDELFKILPPAKHISPEHVSALAPDTVASIIPDHIAESRKRFNDIVSIQQEIEELERYSIYLDALGELADESETHDDIEWIGVQVESHKDLVDLQDQIESKYEGKVVVEAVTRDDGDQIAVITTERELFHDVLKTIQEMKLVVYRPPEDLRSQPCAKQKNIITRRIGEKKGMLSLLREQEDNFTRKWQSEYQKIRNLVDSQLSLIKVTAAVVRTRMCFFIYGWLPASDFQLLENELEKQFGGKVVLEESELAEKDFSRIPTALHNPVYFEPFELFTRLLPMPPYASFDLTPFIGIFFPIFFGMMLGDIGYGVILLCIAFFLIRRFAGRRNLKDAGKILFISSLYTIVFGLFYGELFGTIGHTFLGLKPIIFDRRTSIIPMFCFAVAVGVVHVILGLVLGVILSLRHHLKKEAIFKLVNIFVILCLCILAVSYFTPSMTMVQKPLLLTIGIATPVLFIVGGIMAPLELLKNVGNIISYARIMAIGLTSVLLAYVANYVAGRIGSVWAGIIVAVLLHTFNLLLGVFAPTIHSLRLHYVEFLSKFMEPGGKEFRPLGGKK